MRRPLCGLVCLALLACEDGGLAPQVVVSLEGRGTVVEVASGEVCPETCSFPRPVELAARPATNARFVGWRLGCAGQDNCKIAPPATVEAAFEDEMGRLRLQVTGSGGGRIELPPAPPCAADCARGPYAVGSVLQLTAVPDVLSSFVGFTGVPDCGVSPECQLSIAVGDQTISARFDRDRYRLRLAPTGGSLAPSPAGDDCGPGCHEYAAGSEVMIRATPAPHHDLAAWTGACATSSSDLCTLQMTSDHTVGMSFTPRLVRLTISASGDGQGAVRSTPAGIDCASCAADFLEGTEVTLQATPVGNSSFEGWGGACAGQLGACRLRLDADTDVQASFQLIRVELSVEVRGAGRVVSTAARIDCGEGERCSYSVPLAVPISLAAEYDPTPVAFTGWGGDCSGSSVFCALPMRGPARVQAAFVPARYRLQHNVVGTGQVALSPLGAPCGTDCSEYDYGTLVTLTATTTLPHEHVGWADDCAGAPPEQCTLALEGPRVATALFAENYVTLSVLANGPGSVVSTPPGIQCPGTCSAYFHNTQVVSLAPVPSYNGAFWNWTGGCGGVASCSVSLAQPVQVGADFGLTCDEQAVVLPGANARINFPISFGATSYNSTELTVEGWVRVANPGTASGPLFSRANTAIFQCAWELSLVAGAPRFCVYTACSPVREDAQCAQSATPLPAGVFAHVAGMFVRGAVVLTVGGVEVGRTPVPMNFAASTNVTTPLVVGGRPGSAAAGLAVDVANLRLSNQGLYPAAVPPLGLGRLPSTLILTPMEEGSGTVVADRSPAGSLPGALVGSAAWVGHSVCPQPPGL